MIKLFRRMGRYMTALFTGKFNEAADPKVQLEQAIMEAQEQHRRLTEQAANVIANQKQTEMRLNRAMEELEKINAPARQALIMADEARKQSDDRQGHASTRRPPSCSPRAHRRSSARSSRSSSAPADDRRTPTTPSGPCSRTPPPCRRSWPSARSSCRSSTRRRCRSR